MSNNNFKRRINLSNKICVEIGKVSHQMTVEFYLIFLLSINLCAYIELVVLRETQNIFEKNQFCLKQSKLLEKAYSEDLCDEDIPYNQHFYLSS